MIGRTPSAYAMLVAVEDGDRVELATAGYSAPNVRLASAIQMLRELLARGRALHAPAPGQRSMTVFQFDDCTHQTLACVALGRPVGFAPLAELIVDPYFYLSHGFDELRRAALDGSLPAWSARTDTLFWRGRGSHRGLAADGTPVQRMADVPRTALALRLRGHPHADVGMVGPWMQAETDEEAKAWLAAEGILRPYTAMAEHARHRFQLDIDGVANAWATLERFLCGSCVLKVGTPFEMWFYDAMRPWEHFVPVRPDAADLEAMLEWCLAHPRECESIAAAGQRLALSLTYEVAVERAVAALGRVRVVLG